MRTIFFCGHKSPYGLCHLEPLINSSLGIVGIVLATDKRWEIFRKSLIGEQYLVHRKSSALAMILKLRRILIAVVRLMLRFLFRSNAAPSIIPEPPDAVKVAIKYGIPIYYTDDVNSENFLKIVDEIKPDLIISAAYPQIFRKELLQKPILGAVNFHPSLLPKFRGAHPHFWAICQGEEKSGITAHFMTENIDDGDIIAQIEFPIAGYTYPELYKKIVEETPKLVNKINDFFIKDLGKAWKQDDSMSTYYKSDRPIHYRIFWNTQTAKEIYNLVRTERAFCFFRNSKVVINKCYLAETNRNLTNNVKVENGTIIDIYKNSLVVKVEKGCINIESVFFNGKKMSFLKFAKKIKIQICEKFE